MQKFSFDLYCSTATNNPKNKYYKIHFRIVDEKQLVGAIVCSDNAPALYEGFERLEKCFKKANVLFAELDNDHSENPEDWYTEDMLFEMFKDVGFYITGSKNHLKPKQKGKRIFPARPKFHIYFPLNTDVDLLTYKTNEKKLCTFFPLFDHAFCSGAQALGANLQGSNLCKYHYGEKTIIQFLEEKNIEIAPVKLIDTTDFKIDIEGLTQEVDIIGLLEAQREKAKDVKKSIIVNRQLTQYHTLCKALFKHNGNISRAVNVWIKTIVQCEDWEWLLDSNEGRTAFIYQYKNAITWFYSLKAHKEKENRKHIETHTAQNTSDNDADDKLIIREGKALPPPIPKTNLQNKFAIPLTSPDFPDIKNIPSDDPKKPSKLYVYPRSIENLIALLKFYNTTIKYNLLTKHNEFYHGNELYKNEGRARADILINCDLENFHIGKELMNEFLNTLAQDNCYNPVCIYLNKCENDYKYDEDKGYENINKLWNCLKIKEDKKIYKILFVKWLMNAYLIAFNQGEYAAQGILVLQGKQGINKTRFVKYLGGKWSQEGIMFSKCDKDDISKATRCWIGELGELGGSLKHEKLNFLKNFITSTKDIFRPPYGREELEFPRLSAYIGTINELTMLKDSTGDRRYWVIPVEAIEGYEDINIDAVWAEVAHLCKNENKIEPWLSTNEMKLLIESNRDFEIKSTEESILYEKLNWEMDVANWKAYSALELCDLLNIHRDKKKAVSYALNRISTHDERVSYKKIHGIYKYKLPKIDKFAQNIEDNPFC